MDLKSELEDIAASDGSAPLLRSVMNQIRSTDHLVSFLHRYSVFNGDFAGGVAGLAGAFHIRRDLFRDPNSKMSDCSDRAADIASHIYFAAEDEYSDRNNPNIRITHRRLGQLLLEHTLRYFRISADEFRNNFPINLETKDVLRRVVSGYCLERKNNEAGLFRGLGFHLGSELLADREFNIIDEHLAHNFSELVQYLKNTSVADDTNAYTWIELHTHVEEEHFLHAARAAEMSMEYYAGERNSDEVKALILEGFSEFSHIQKQFFKNVLQRVG